MDPVVPGIARGTRLSGANSWQGMSLACRRNYELRQVIWHIVPRRLHPVWLPGILHASHPV